MDKISNTDLLELVSKIHHNEEDFIDGDIEDRIMKSSEYYLTTVCPQLIDQEFYINEELVEKYCQLNPKNCPPIILHKYEDGEYSIVDGSHRIEAFKKMNITSIKAYIGIIK